MNLGSRNRIARGMFAGLLGGVAGSAAKLAGEAIYPPRDRGQEAPPAVLAEKLADHSLSKPQKSAATQIMHWTLGTGIGAAYGIAAELTPIVTAGFGVGFGIAVMLGTHESTLPLLGLNEPPTNQSAREQTSELVTHALYGCVTELVRSWLVRRWALGKLPRTFPSTVGQDSSAAKPFTNAG